MVDVTTYENLANAIILQAVKDYRSALNTLKKHRCDRNAEHERRSMERFFRSDWFKVLTDADGERIIRGLKEEAGI